MCKELQQDKTISKEIEMLKNAFRIVANSPPQTDPFMDCQAWNDWTDECRSFEIALSSLGVIL